MSSDEILLAIQALKNGDMSAFETLYEQTKRMVFFAARAVLKDHARSEDVMQDAYIRFLDSLDRVQIDRGAISFLVTTARNLALNVLRKEGRAIELDEHFRGEEDDRPLIGERLFERMRDLLDDQEYEIVILHAVDELKHREIAEMMDLPLGTVTWKYSSAIAKLRSGLEDLR